MSSEMSFKSNSSESSNSDKEESSNNVSEGSDDELKMLLDSDCDEEEFAGFGIDLPANNEWGNERFKPPINEFTVPVDPTMDLQDSLTVIDIFMHFFDNKLTEEIIQFTNINAKVEGV